MDYAFISLCTAAGCCDGLVIKQRNKKTELQKRVDRADQSVLFFLAGANFLGKAREKLCYYVHGSYHLCHSTLS